MQNFLQSHWWLCLVAQSCSTLCNPMDCNPPGSSVHGDFPGKNTGVACHTLLQMNLPNSKIKLRSPALQMDSLPSEPPGKAKNIGVGSLSLLQGIFPTQESTRISCVAGGFFTSWALREAPYLPLLRSFIFLIQLWVTSVLSFQL